MHLDGWTLLLQLVNLLVLLALLRWLFLRPLLAVIDARRSATAAAADRAQAALREADARSQALDGERAALAASREAVLQAAREDAGRERDQMRQAAAADAQRALDDLRRQADEERRRARRALVDEAAGLACKVAERLLRSVPAGGDAATLRSLAARVAAVPAAARAAWFAQDAGRHVDVVTAAPLAEPQRVEAGTLLQATLGSDTTVAFVVEPALLAGAELRFAHGVLAQHWAAELAAARAALAAEDAP